MRIYFDHNATTPVDPAVVQTVARTLADDFGNASSVHHFGQRAKGVLDDARSAVAALVGGEPSEIVFTSGGTESDNFALRGVAEALEPTGRRHLIASSIEHEAILVTLKALARRGWRVTLLPVDKDGLVDIREEVDNEHFANLLRTHLKERYDVRVGERIAGSPLLVPLVLEHLWRHCSSRQVWEAIRAKGEPYFLRYARGPYAKALRKEGAALKLLQEQWTGLLQHFDDVFLQPVVFWPPGLLRNASLLSFTLRADSDERIVDLAQRASQRSVVTAVMPEAGSGGLCRMWCNPPNDQLPAVLRLVGDYHRGPKPPLVGVADLYATRRATHPGFLGFDWQSFDVETFSWRFDGEAYVERLKAMKIPGRNAGVPGDDTLDPKRRNLARLLG